MEDKWLWLAGMRDRKVHTSSQRAATTRPKPPAVGEHGVQEWMAGPGPEVVQELPPAQLI